VKASHTIQMVLLAHVPYVQEQVTDLAPKIHRVFKKKEKDVYAVTVDSQGQSGQAHYEYEIRLIAEHPEKDSKDTQVAVTFLNLRGKVNDMELPRNKVFGTASYEFPETGLPADFSFGGKNVTFVLPILSWYLPIEAVSPGDDFKVKDMVFDGTIHVRGSGTVVKPGLPKVTIKLVLSIIAGNATTEAPDHSDSSYTSIATFNPQNGMLESAEGNMKGFGGTVSFHLKKV